MSEELKTSAFAKPGQYLTFQIAEEQYGLPIETVREINRVGEITPVPKTPNFVKGVMNLRGKIIPVIQLRVRFGMPEKDYNRDTCIIVIDTQNGQMGMIVDAVKEVVDLKASQIERPPVLGNSKALEFVRGMGKLENRVLILVDVISALDPEQLKAIDEIGENSNAA